MGHSRPLFSLFSSFQYTVDSQQMFNKFCRWLYLNRGPLVLEATGLPTELHNHCPYFLLCTYFISLSVIACMFSVYLMCITYFFVPRYMFSLSISMYLPMFCLVARFEAMNVVASSHHFTSIKNLSFGLIKGPWKSRTIWSCLQLSATI